MIWSLLLGCVLGVGLNVVIARQLWKLSADASTQTELSLPFLGRFPQHAGMALVVIVLATIMSAALWQRYGWTANFWLLLSASLVLIDTAVIDWRVRLIDTLVLTGAMIAAVLLAPWITGSWLASLLGVLGASVVFIIIFLFARLLYPGHAAPFGLGDIYLGMFIGALLGIVHVGAALLYGMLLAGGTSLLLIAALGYRRARHIPIAYGSFLCVGTLLYLALWQV